MKLKVNGQEVHIDQSLHLDDLLRHLSIKTQAIAIAVNSEVVPRSEVPHRWVKENDVIEIIHPVGGG